MARMYLRALRFEAIRLRSVRSTWVLLLLALTVNGLIAWAMARDVRAGQERLDDPEAVVSLLTGASGVGPLSFTALFVGLVGVLALGQDYRHGLTSATLTAIPRRGVLLAAKLTVTAAFAAVAAVLAVAAAYAVGAAVIGGAWTFSLLGDGSAPRALGGFVALIVLTALLGVALAGILRNMRLAVLALLAFPLLLEPLLIRGLEMFDAAGRDVAAYLPFTAGAQMVNLPGGDGPGYSPVFQDALVGGLTFLAFVAVAAALAAVLFARRDVPVRQA